ncbi:MAG: DsrE family protein [Candidatus Rokubacteria bacterium]|nr:DsrE family protein [Candidatus Rokubacteria bacterium]
MADRRTAFLFTRYGLGDAPEDLGLKVLGNFLGLLRQSDELPAALLFYTNGVKLACEGSPVLDALRSFDEAGVHLTVCRTCIEYFGLKDRVRVGVVGGMPDILDTMERADKVVTV